MEQWEYQHFVPPPPHVTRRSTALSTLILFKIVIFVKIVENKVLLKKMYILTFVYVSSSVLPLPKWFALLSREHFNEYDAVGEGARTEKQQISI